MSTMSDIEVGDEILWGTRTARVVSLDEEYRRVLFIQAKPSGELILNPEGTPEVFWTGPLEWVLTRDGIDDGQMPFRNP